MSELLSGGEYVVCQNPKCEAQHYLADDDLLELFGDSTEEIKNPDELDYNCPNCGECFDCEEKTDPSEADMREWYKQCFSDCSWAQMTATDVRCGYVDYIDILHRDEQISDYMAENCDGWEGDK